MIEIHWAPPRDVPDYHRRHAAHLRALAETTTTEALKTRLLRDAAEHERLARPEAERAVGSDC